MEAKIQKLKSYLKEPERAIKGNDSLLVTLQDILHVREHTPTEETQYDRDIYELFHATMSLFFKPIGGTNAWLSKKDKTPLFKVEVNGDGNYTNPEDWNRENRFRRENIDNDDLSPVQFEHRYSRWDIISPPFQSSSEDEKIARYQGFHGEIKASYEVWNDFQSHLRIDKAMIEYQRRKGNRRTTLQSICDSYIMIAFNFNHAVNYDEYIREITDVATDEAPQVKYTGIADALKEYIRGATDYDLEAIITHKALPSGASQKEWIGNPADAHRFLDKVGITVSQWKKCFRGCFEI